MTTTQPRDVRLGRLFVQLADSLVSDFDVVELLDQLVASCVELLDVPTVGLMLADPQGRLHVMAASAEEIRLLELFELQNQQGPCLECYRTGERVVAESAEEQARRWPSFAPRMRDLDLGAVYALPLRLRDQTIGALNIFRPVDSTLLEADLLVAQALADVATITVLQHRATEASERLAAQLQTALNSRIAIEQAKGVIAQHAGLGMDRAFDVLRRYARSAQQPLTEVAGRLASGRLDPAAVARRRRS
ncbi:MAG TPA: GAF and ANTAR domain-containing protein [Microlunatus sp.]|nr:GAF and ANTAR domain-containing protein [Microlunatus sp.]